MSDEDASDRLDEMEGELREKDAENKKLRALLAASDADCPYCELPAHEMERCEMGFPGCSRADDLSLHPKWPEIPIGKTRTFINETLAQEVEKLGKIKKALSNFQQATVIVSVRLSKLQQAVHLWIRSGGSLDDLKSIVDRSND